MALLDDDGVNVETAVLAHELNGPRTSGTLRCVLQVSNLKLSNLVRIDDRWTSNAGQAFAAAYARLETSL